MFKTERRPDALTPSRLFWPGLLIGLGFTLFASPVNAARPDAIRPARPAYVRVAVRIHADTMVRQALVAIRSSSSDSAWLEESSERLLDRFRGEAGETAASTFPDTVLRAIRALAADAGLTTTDTLVRTLGRRILRAPSLERDAAAGYVRKTSTGGWAFVHEEDSGDLDAEFARIRFQEDEVDRAALAAEIARQAASGSAPSAECSGCPVSGGRGRTGR